ncbi:MAG: hypothetical protein NC827_05940 [Candidatus Omnitrophica bacterium]|nr:hypothetical protein [Candidatus Omnitrophota bacterium]
MLDKIARVFKKKHSDIYEALVRYAEKRGVKISDVIGSAVLSYLSADEEGKAELEKMVAEKAYTPVGQKSYQAFLETFTNTAKTIVDTMVTIQEAGQRLVKGSILNELKSNIETIEEIKKIGASGGSESLEDILASAFIKTLLGRAGIRLPEKRESGTGKVKEIKEEET